MDVNQQCPFVNRPDARCSGRLSIDRLDHAFEYCFSAYNTCPVYVERLLERRVRQIARPVVTPQHGLLADGPTFIQLRTPADRRAARVA